MFGSRLYIMAKGSDERVCNGRRILGCNEDGMPEGVGLRTSARAQRAGRSAIDRSFRLLSASGPKIVFPGASVARGMSGCGNL
jgi:hypothetical protein